MARAMRLGDLLLRAGVISPEQLQQALGQQERWGGKLGTILVRMNALSEDLLVKALSRQLNIPRADLTQISIPPPLRSRLTKEVCEEYNVIPLRYDAEKRAVLMAVSDPFNVVILDDLSRRINLKIEPHLAGEMQILAAIQQQYGARLEGSAASGGADMRLLNNQNSTLIKRRDEIRPPNESRPPAPASAPSPSPRASAPSPSPRPSSSALATPASSSPGNGTDDRLADLDKLAQKQSKAVRAILELLIEKGVLTREEYLSWVSRR